MRIKRYLSIALCAAMALAYSPQANAELLVYESFDYAVATELTGQSGGIGFDAAWTGRANNLANVPAGSTSIQAGSLVGPAGLTSQGNHALITGANGTAQPFRAFTAGVQAQIAGLQAANGSLWISFLAQRQGQANNIAGGVGSNFGSNPYPRGVNVSFFALPDNEQIGVGNTSGAFDNTWSIIPNGSGALREAAYDPAGANPGSTTAQGFGPTTPGAAIIPWNDLHWAVMRIDYNAGNQSTYLWIDPDPNGPAPDISNADATILGTDTNTTDMLGLAAVRMFVGNNAGTANTANFQPFGVLAMDELRVGTNFASMNATSVVAVPEPSALAVALLSSVGLAFRRRR